jgi:hypothetical protein
MVSPTPERITQDAMKVFVSVSMETVRKEGGSRVASGKQ